MHCSSVLRSGQVYAACVMAARRCRQRRAEALGLMQNWITTHRGSIRSAIAALKAAGIGHRTIPVAGIDGVSDAIRAVAAGDMVLSIRQDATWQAPPTSPSQASGSSTRKCRQATAQPSSTTCPGPRSPRPTPGNSWRHEHTGRAAAQGQGAGGRGQASVLQGALRRLPSGSPADCSRPRPGRFAAAGAQRWMNRACPGTACRHASGGSNARMGGSSPV